MKSAVLYIGGTLIAVVTGYFVFISLGSDKNKSFNASYKDAIERLDKIDSALNHATGIINETHRKLGEIKLYVDTLKTKQQASNNTVAANDEILRKNLVAKEYELKQLKQKYKQVQTEKELLSDKLDSLAMIIGND